MADEPTFEQLKARRRMVKLAHELKTLVESDEYRDLNFHYFVASDEGERTYGGNMCPVCGATAMMMICIERGLEHIEPELKEGADRMKEILRTKMVSEDKSKYN